MKMESITTATGLLSGVSSDTQVIYNNGGVFGGIAGCTLNDATGVLTATGLTATNCAVLGSDSAVFQPNADSTTFFALNDKDGNIILGGDTVNNRIGINTNAPTLELDIVSPSASRVKFGFPSASWNPAFIVDAQDDTSNTGKFFGGVAGTNGAVFTYDQTGYFGIEHEDKPEDIGATGNHYNFMMWQSGAVVISGNAVQGEGWTDPGTFQLSLTSVAPYFQMHNTTHEDADGGRESRINFKGEQSGGEETTLARIEASHDGAADDEKGKLVFSTNATADTDTPTPALTINSAQLTELTSTTTQLRLTHTDGVDECDFSVDSDGVLQIAPTARTVHIGDATDGDHTLLFVGDTSSMMLHHVDDSSCLRISNNDATNYLQIGTDGSLSFAGTARFYPRYLEQAAEPAAGTGATQCDTGEFVVWRDTDGGAPRFAFNHDGTVYDIGTS